jgi:hypothetical protein
MLFMSSGRVLELNGGTGRSAGPAATGWDLRRIRRLAQAERRENALLSIDKRETG